MNLRFNNLCLITILLSTGATAGAAASSVQDFLRREIVGTNLPLAEVQDFCEKCVPLMPAVKSAADWVMISEKMRRDVLDRVVFRGEAANWRRGETKIFWRETIDGGPGYHIRKLRFEAVPGCWIPALLYEPEKISGKVPVMLAVNGHDAQGKAADYKQIRCINLAKRGLIVLNVEWLGMGQLRGDDFAHARMNQLDLCGTSGVAPYFLSMQRGLDVLLAHKNADPERVAVSGLSGGGWQTIFISALDPRVKLSNPVAGYSSFRTRARFLEDLGDSEQTPCDLATVADYAHLTAMRAPRPTLLTFNAKDNCCFASGHSLEPLLDAAGPIFKLFGREDFLRTHINYVPGDHNFGQENREALYKMVRDFFYAGSGNFETNEIACDSEIKTAAQLQVELPADNAGFHSLALALSQKLPRSIEKPPGGAALADWQKKMRAKLRDVVKSKNYAVVAEKTGSDDKDDLKVAFWKLKMDAEWTVPAVEFVRGEAKGTTLLVSDQGRKNLAAEVENLLGQGQRVVALDPFYFGESAIRARAYLFALLVAAVGDRPIGIEAGQLAAAARWAGEKFSQPVSVMAVGPGSGAYALIAAALEQKAINHLELRGALGSFREVIEKNWTVDQRPELFCFGLLEAFDVKQLEALVEPRLSHGPNP
jgi:dienelactone hydrolase